jgi:ABC-2 type transport system ATP-binding protein
MLLQTERLGKRYRRAQPFAVEELSLQLAPGELLGLLGPNGAGKTTTIRMLLGLSRPTTGRVLLAGTPVTPGCAALARAGALVEGPAFYPWLSGQANLEVALAARGAPRRQRRRRAREVGETVGLGEALGRRVGTYSAGMRRRLGLAAALAPDPELLILDEPAAELDPAANVMLRDLLRREARERNRAILLSSHLLGEVEALADRVLLLREGRVRREGPLQELLVGQSGRVGVELEDPASTARAAAVARGVPGVQVLQEQPLEVETDRAGRARLVAALVEARLPPVAVLPRRRSLEELFLEEYGTEDGA